MSNITQKWVKILEPFSKMNNRYTAGDISNLKEDNINENKGIIDFISRCKEIREDLNDMKIMEIRTKIKKIKNE